MKSNLSVANTIHILVLIFLVSVCACAQKARLGVTSISMSVLSPRFGVTSISMSVLSPRLPLTKHSNLSSALSPHAKLLL